MNPHESERAAQRCWALVDDRGEIAHVLWKESTAADMAARHGYRMVEMVPATSRDAEREIAALRNALSWARATFDLRDLPEDGDAIDQLLARDGVEPLGGSRPHRRSGPGAFREERS